MRSLWANPEFKSGLTRLAITGLCFLSACESHAQQDWYLELDVGVAGTGNLDVLTGGMDDWVVGEGVAHSSIRCDVTINPDRFQTAPGACSDAPAEWGPMNESFDSGTGILAGLAVGRRIGRLRVEGEFYHFSATHDSRAVPTTPDYDPGADRGYSAVEDAVETVVSTNIFANLYYDLRRDDRLSPYVGFGVGAGDVEVGYQTLWHRTSDPEFIRVFDTEGLSGDDLQKAQDLNRRISGTLTYDRARLANRLFGYQLIAGLDYRVSGPVSIGLKIRWAAYGEFEDESPYDLLRDHASVAGNPPVPVTYYVRTDDIAFWGIGLNAKIHF